MMVNDYLDLIPSENRLKPNFTAMISGIASLAVQMQNVSSSMIPLFDVDIAVGDQLDQIGQWVGVSRNVSIPISGVYFSWDSSDAQGWDFGIWQANNTPANITVLPDDVYRTLIRATIAANHWDGTTDGAYAVWDNIFPDITILIQDNQNMSYALALVGGIIDSLTLALLTGGYIPLRPEGVQASVYYVSTGPGLVFSWDTESTILGGWDESSWLIELAPS